MFGRRLWKTYLPLSLFLIGCSESNIGVRTSPDANDRGIRGPNLLQFSNLEAAKQYGAEMRRRDMEMGKILYRLHLPLMMDSDERTSLKSEWTKLDREIGSAQNVDELRELSRRVGALDTKVRFSDQPPKPPDENQRLETFQEAVWLQLAMHADAMSALKTQVEERKEHAIHMEYDELRDWGEASQFVETLEIGYASTRAATRAASSWEGLARISWQLTESSNKMTHLMKKLLKEDEKPK